MRDLILKWWYRKWSNWEFDEELKVFSDDYSDRPVANYHIYKCTSSDGLVKFKRIRK